MQSPAPAVVVCAGAGTTVERSLAFGASTPGHAGAIVMGDKDSYASKRSALEGAGVCVLDTPSDVGTALKAALEG